MPVDVVGDGLDLCLHWRLIRDRAVNQSDGCRGGNDRDKDRLRDLNSGAHPLSLDTQAGGYGSLHDSGPSGGGRLLRRDDGIDGVESSFRSTSVSSGDSTPA